MQTFSITNGIKNDENKSNVLKVSCVEKLADIFIQIFIVHTKITNSDFSFI